MKARQKKEYKPRVLVKANIGTRVMKSKRDKAYSRQSLKLELKNAY
jgi:predicted acetyltransferase